MYQNLFVSIIIIVIIFLITREFWCWYFKINKVADLLEQQLKEQKRSNELMLKLMNENERPAIEKIKNEKNSLES